MAAVALLLREATTVADLKIREDCAEIIVCVDGENFSNLPQLTGFLNL